MSSTESITTTTTIPPPKPPNQPSLKSLRSAIPPHCFTSSLPRSTLYLARDLIYTLALLHLTTYIPSLSSPTLRILSWTAYTFIQGLVGTGLWILAHECGHDAFSPYPRVNDAVGWFLHSVLLVPYFSWKIIHGRHHRYTGHMTRDTAFVPLTEDEFMDRNGLKGMSDFYHLVEETPLASAVGYLVAHQVVAWPMYLLFYVSGGRESLDRSSGDGDGDGVGKGEGDGKGGEKAKSHSHFNPSSGLFAKSQWLHVILSDLGLIAMLSFLAYAGTKVGWTRLGLLYGVPYLWVHHWLVAITYLHHTHPSIPHYSPSKWSFVNGALCTVDRHYGLIGHHFFHEIIDYHVVHHLFPKIPFYHVKEATEAVMPLLGDRYVSSKDEGYVRGFVRTFGDSWFVKEKFVEQQICSKTYGRKPAFISFKSPPLS
ncbi:hypothetical protein P170DRAFT_487561 [Aspergillus steynii IBT 23096]|uniref:Fatty acid desaturase domain-containing protein n=1 Tax=Aspergillus steynii IBT 23096 TaxID=1392250 RepID=A0A2I2GF73_9EURO|nr:uncharacterized protein P170DRAFT_487561 [Aspergillus steynii IBT 23096]PLB51529.1 hypothetical protein P170DRAFT_487561 [Aspergillus steynii IBT 23096]